MNRRQFLEALLCIPALAAFPALPEALAAEEATPSPILGRWWCSLNGLPIDMLSIAIDQEEQEILVTSLYTPFGVAGPIRDLRTTTINLSAYVTRDTSVGLKDVFYVGEPALLKADFEWGTLSARVVIKTVSHEFDPTLLARVNVEMVVLDMDIYDHFAYR